MAVSKNLVRRVLARFTLLFDAPLEARSDWDAALDCWVGLLDGLSEEAFLKRASVLAKTLRRFPVPNDFLTATEAAEA